MLPFLGQGASMAIEDGMILGRALAADDDPVAGLQRYEQARRGRADTIVALSAAQAARSHRNPPSPETENLHARADVFDYNPATVAI